MSDDYHRVQSRQDQVRRVHFLPRMKRHTILIASAAWLLTFAWLLVPDLKHSPAALWPSVLAVGLAFVTRDIYLSLFVGAFGGAVLLAGGNPATAFIELFTRHLIPALADRWNLSVLIFTLLMGGFVEVLNRNGGMTALSARVMGRSGSARRAGLGAYGLGWLVFFDGLANAMLIGKTVRPVADRARLSREKLAFIVDSTSSPIAGLALLSTWVAYEMSVIREGFAHLGNAVPVETAAPFSWLVMSLPYRFYNWFVLLLVFLVVWRMRDWGPMLTAEKAARSKPSPASVRTETSGNQVSIALALVPLAVLVLGVFAGLFLDGGGWDRPLNFPNLVQAFGAANAANVFVVATALASLLAMLLSSWWPRADASPRSSYRDAFFQGMQQMFLPALILVFAWMLNSVIKEMGTAGYLVSLLGDRLPEAGLPAAVFLLAACVSFSTGTSWGTMAIVMPLTVPLAVKLTGMTAGGTSNPVMAATIGAVLAGAVFGDHCSPISDTTVVSAFSSECEVMAHVRTQLPYALAAAVVAVVLGYGPAGFGLPSWLLLPLGGAAIWMLVHFIGQPTER